MSCLDCYSCPVLKNELFFVCLKKYGVAKFSVIISLLTYSKNKRFNFSRSNMFYGPRYTNVDFVHVSLPFQMRNANPSCYFSACITNEQRQAAKIKTDWTNKANERRRKRKRISRSHCKGSRVVWCVCTHFTRVKPINFAHWYTRVAC